LCLLISIVYLCQGGGYETRSVCLSFSLCMSVQDYCENNQTA